MRGSIPLRMSAAEIKGCTGLSITFDSLLKSIYINLSVCGCVCVCVCLFVSHSRPGGWADRAETWWVGAQPPPLRLPPGGRGGRGLMPRPRAKNRWNAGFLGVLTTFRGCWEALGVVAVINWAGPVGPARLGDACLHGHAHFCR